MGYAFYRLSLTRNGFFGPGPHALRRGRNRGCRNARDSARGGKTAEERKANQAASVLKLLESVPPDAAMIVLPEAVLTPWPDDTKTDFKDAKHARQFAHELPKLHAVPTEDPFAALAAIAKKKNAFLQIGVLERDKDSDRVYNAAIVFSPEGKVVAKHRKVNLTPEEQKYVSAGDHRITTFDGSKAALGEVGVAVCADIYDGGKPHLMEKYRASEISLLAVSTEWQVEKDPEEGHTKGGGPTDFFRETARYLNRGEGLLNEQRFPEPPQAAPGFKKRVDRTVHVAFSNSTEPAKGAGLFHERGELKNRLPPGKPWQLSCLPKVAPPKKDGAARGTHGK